MGCCHSTEPHTPRKQQPQTQQPLSTPLLSPLDPYSSDPSASPAPKRIPKQRRPSFDPSDPFFGISDLQPTHARRLLDEETLKQRRVSSLSFREPEEEGPDAARDEEEAILRKVRTSRHYSLSWGEHLTKEIHLVRSSLESLSLSLYLPTRVQAIVEILQAKRLQAARALSRGSLSQTHFDKILCLLIETRDAAVLQACGDPVRMVRSHVQAQYRFEFPGRSRWVFGEPGVLEAMRCDPFLRQALGALGAAELRVIQTLIGIEKDSGEGDVGLHELVQGGVEVVRWIRGWLHFSPDERDRQRLGPWLRVATEWLVVVQLAEAAEEEGVGAEGSVELPVESRLPTFDFRRE